MVMSIGFLAKEGCTCFGILNQPSFRSTYNYISSFNSCLQAWQIRIAEVLIFNVNGFKASDGWAGWRTICCRRFATDPTSAPADVCGFCCKLFMAGKIPEVVVVEQVNIPGRLVAGEVNVV